MNEYINKLEQINKNLYIRVKELEDIRDDIKHKLNPLINNVDKGNDSISFGYINSPLNNWVITNPSNLCTTSIDPFEEFKKQIGEINKKLEKVCEKMGI